MDNKQLAFDFAKETDLLDEIDRALQGDNTVEAMSDHAQTINDTSRLHDHNSAEPCVCDQRPPKTNPLARESRRAYRWLSSERGLGDIGEQWRGSRAATVDDSKEKRGQIPPGPLNLSTAPLTDSAPSGTGSTQQWDESASEYEIAALEVGRLVKEKNKAYGSSFLDAAKIMAILYPDGIRPDQYEDATVMVRVIDKLKRVATDNDPYGEDPWEDITGYGLLSRVRRTHKRKETTRADLGRE